jgi:hypothetical protein
MSDAYVLEVIPAERSGRGRFWRPAGTGYTNDPGQAGVWPGSHARVRYALREADALSYRAVPVEQVLSELQAEADAAAQRVDAFRVLVDLARALDAGVSDG